ncbi:Pre-mRNA-splicing factor cef-1 [Astathelohania contejeani]|uniref:Pre-mRNA-splicing factor cef-1 n=1 Tax=Astathelohania contejeani TaxID=164912 RepID=A0ABQ7HVE1_9MICR|nr:Pre-mRNA-splicing factor cef-1 [Thelohania contejeani]
MSIWTATDDELLKAGIMKYGPNQWSKVSSLLPHKTPSQCKARWQNWLHPTINRDAWTAAEDAALLQACEVLPSQWNSIATLVGRTAQQCHMRLSELQGISAPLYTHTEFMPSKEDTAPDTDLIAITRARLANTKSRKKLRQERKAQHREEILINAQQRREKLKEMGLPAGKYKEKECKFTKIEIKPKPVVYDTLNENNKCEVKIEKLFKSKKSKKIKLEAENKEEFILPPPKS